VLDPAVFLGLDAVSAALTLAVAVYFARLWSVTRQPLHLLFSLGIALVGASFATVTASTFDLGRSPEIWDHLRIAGQVGGALVIMFAYASARATGRAKPLQSLGFAAAGLSLLFAILYFAIPPAFVFQTRSDFIVAHSVMGIAWAVTAVLALGGPSVAGRERLLVPGAFVCFAFSKYTWLLVDVADAGLAPFIYPWRFAGILLMIAAIMLPARRPKEADARSS
jgi:hypothetical protein